MLGFKFHKSHTFSVTWKLCVAVARHNFKWLKNEFSVLSGYLDDKIRGGKLGNIDHL